MQLCHNPDDPPNIGCSNKFTTDEQKLSDIFKDNVYKYESDDESHKKSYIMECRHLWQVVRTL